MEIKTITWKEIADDYNNKEWPGYEEEEEENCMIKPKLLIMELWRLVPSLEEEYVRFSPINMPTIKIGCIRIIGLILHVCRNLKQYKFIVDDGTGIVNVVCSLKYFGTTQKEDEEKAEVLEDGLEEKELLAGDYVQLQGFLSLSEYNKAYINCEDKNPIGRLIYGQPLFYAVNVKFISEKQYYKKMHHWLKEAKKRYT